LHLLVERDFKIEHGSPMTSCHFQIGMSRKN
jgi:hypothetical protein